jgi:hypothetical protein
MRFQHSGKAVRLFLSAIFFATLGITACGDKKKDDESGNGESCTENCVGEVKVFLQSGQNVTAKFTTAEEGAEYVVMPYVLGSSADVLGSSAEKVSFDVAQGEGEATKFRIWKAAKRQDGGAMDAKLFDHAQRTMYRRFDRSKGMNQEPGFWKAVDALDRVAAVSFAGDSVPVTRGFRKAFETSINSPKKAVRTGALNLTTAGECPATNGKVQVPNPELDDVEDVGVIDAVSDAEFCIAYVSEPVTESDKDAIKASVTAVVDRYKNVIYKDELKSTSAFTFKPLFVIADFSDEDAWPPKAEDQLQVAGVVLDFANAALKRPVIYMAADFSKLGSLPTGTEAATATKVWHGTLAHETQHAIMDYFKKYVGTAADGDTVAVDEGIAHFMEDVFGYGEENFSGYAGAFLSTWNDGITPVLNGTLEVVRSNTDRGASQALMYYLASMKGGVFFTDGVVSGGGGLDFIRNVVKSKKKGPANLQENFGGTWAETIGNYMGALVLDGTAIENIADVNDAQDPVADVHDLNGGTNKTFGMSYNKYLDVEDRSGSYVVPEDVTKVEDLLFYQTMPMLFKVSDPSVTYIFTTSGSAAITNTAVAVVRIK